MLGKHSLSRWLIWGVGLACACRGSGSMTDDPSRGGMLGGDGDGDVTSPGDGDGNAMGDGDGDDPMSNGGQSDGGSSSSGGSDSGSGGDPGAGGETNAGGCVAEVARFYLRDDQTVWNAAGTVNPTLTQIKKKSDDSPLTGIIDLASGTRYGCAVDTTERAWCWSGDGAPDNVYGELGDNLPTTTYVDHLATRVLANAPAGDPIELSGVIALQSGSDDCTGSINCAIVSAGGVWCWGKGNNSMLNSMTTGSESRVAVPIESSAGVAMTGVDQVSALDDHICTLSEGTVHCWGSGSYGRLGQGDEVTQKYPKQVDLGGTALKVGVGRDASCALMSDTTVKCWGSNRRGALGIGDPEADGDGCSYPCKTTPVQVKNGDSPLDGVVDLVVGSRSVNTAGFNDVCALRDDGSVWCWGEVMGENEPTQLRNDQDQLLSDAVQISMCAGRLMYVTEDGRVMHKETHSLPKEQASVCE